jgi:hypothetical protein
MRSVPDLRTASPISESSVPLALFAGRILPFDEQGWLGLGGWLKAQRLDDRAAHCT